MISDSRKVTTTCPYCGVGCGLDLHIKNDYIYRVTSDYDNVVNQGNLCVKGRFGYDYIYSERRVTSANGGSLPGMRHWITRPIGWLRFMTEMDRMRWRYIVALRLPTKTTICCKNSLELSFVPITWIIALDCAMLVRL